jgi:hypothetical protein
MPFPLIAKGYALASQFAIETSYGTPPTYVGIGNPYKWIGSVQTTTVTEDKKPILVYRSDGTVASRFPKYILQGAREIDVNITYIPQDINALLSAIGTWSSTLPNSHTLVFAAQDITQQGLGTEGYYYAVGCVANQVTINAKIGQPLSVSIDYYCQDFFEGLPGGLTYSTFQGDTGVVPFFFKNESLAIAGNTLARTLDFQETITNNVERVYQFGQYYLRTAPALLARVQGTFHDTFQSTDGSMDIDDPYWVTDDSNATGITPYTLVLTLGPGHTISHTTAKFQYVSIPTDITDYIALEFHWDAQDITIS